MTDAVTPTDTTGATTTDDGRVWIWRIEMARDAVDCAQFAKAEARPIIPAPERDINILSTHFVGPLAGQGSTLTDDDMLLAAMVKEAAQGDGVVWLEARGYNISQPVFHEGNIAIVGSPEVDMQITQEELDA